MYVCMYVGIRQSVSKFLCTQRCVHDLTVLQYVLIVGQHVCMYVCMYVGGVHGLVCECSDGAVERRLLRVPHPGDHRAAAGELQAGPPARYGPMGIATHERTGAAGFFENNRMYVCMYVLYYILFSKSYA